MSRKFNRDRRYIFIIGVIVIEISVPFYRRFIFFFIKFARWRSYYLRNSFRGFLRAFFRNYFRNCVIYYCFLGHHYVFLIFLTLTNKMRLFGIDSLFVQCSLLMRHFLGLIISGKWLILLQFALDLTQSKVIILTWRRFSSIS